jgi:hypothetical protein
MLNKTQKAYKIYNAAKLNGVKKTKKQAFIEAGFSPKTPTSVIISSPTWKEMDADFKSLVKKVMPDHQIANKLFELIDCEDKRVVLAAIQERNRLADAYPASKLKINEFTQEVSRFTEDEQD